MTSVPRIMGRDGARERARDCLLATPIGPIRVAAQPQRSALQCPARQLTVRPRDARYRL